MGFSLVVAPELWLPHSMWGLSSLITDQTPIPHIGKQILNHWTIKEVLNACFLKEIDSSSQPRAVIRWPELCMRQEKSLVASRYFELMKLNIWEWRQSFPLLSRPRVDTTQVLHFPERTSNYSRYWALTWCWAIRKQILIRSNVAFCPR